VRDLEVSFRTRNGQVRTALTSAELIEINGEPCALSVVADITEAKNLKKQGRCPRVALANFFDFACILLHDFSNGRIVDVIRSMRGPRLQQRSTSGKPLSDVYAPESALKLVSLLRSGRQPTSYTTRKCSSSRKRKQRTVLVNAGP